MFRSRRASRTRSTAAFVPTLSLALLAACHSTPLPIPDPPPEGADVWWDDDARAVGGGAYLGVETRENDSGRLDDLFFEAGVRVARVDPNSPADVAGLRVGDVVLAWNGTELLEPESLTALEHTAEGGERVALEVRRDDAVFEVPVTLRAVADAPAPDEVRLVARVDPVRSRARWRTTDGGVRLLASDDDAPFPAAGVPVGSVVHAIDGRAVSSAAELVRVLVAAEPGVRVDVEWSPGASEDGASDGEPARSARVRLLDVPRVLTGYSIPVLSTYAYDPDADRTNFVLLDLWFISLVRYARDGEEREWRFLRWFSTSSGVGELAE